MDFTARDFRGALLDLDGTLLDHFETLFRCYRDTFVHLGLPVPDRGTVRRSVGGSMEVTMIKLVADANRRDEAAAYWKKHFAKIYLEDVQAMPGALSLLRALDRRGCALGVFTNKIGEQSRGICDHLGFTPHLRFVLGANDTPHRKPERAFTALALERLGVAADETVLLGDSPYDIEAAHALAIPAACVTTGTHNEEELRAAGADAVFPDLFALARPVFGLEIA